MRNRVGLGFDVHPFGSVPPLILGGVQIDEAPALAGHSDGDAVAHAVADALLGPTGLPDLGTLYPASDEQYRGADSMELLHDVAERVRRAKAVTRLAAIAGQWSAGPGGGSTTSTSRSSPRPPGSRTRSATSWSSSIESAPRYCSSDAG